jgi:hypothetical protein
MNRRSFLNRVFSAAAVVIAAPALPVGEWSGFWVGSNKPFTNGEKLNLKVNSSGWFTL